MSDKKRKVCHIVATTEGGTWMFEQLRELRDQYGYEVYAIVSGDKGALVDKLNSEKIPFFVGSFDFGTRKATWRLPFALFRLFKIFRRERFDVVQTHLFFSMIIGRIAAWLADVPLRIEMIASPFHLVAHTSKWIDASTAWMESFLLPSCRKSFDLCREMGVPEKKLALIYYSADENKFAPEQVAPANIRQEFGWEPETPVIANVAYFYPPLSVGRWIPENLQGKAVKGHEDLVGAMPRILAEFPSAKLLLVGKGWGEAGDDYLRKIQTMVREMNLEKNVIFTGYRGDVNGILLDADVAVQASLEENLGGTLEALLMKKPLVVTRIGGMIDVVLDGETGIQVKAEDPQDLARGILQMLRDPLQARILAENGRKLVLEKFTLTKTVADFNELYQRELDRRRRKFYNPVVSLYRLILAVPLLVYLAFRLLIIDMFLPIYAPIYFNRLKGLSLRLYYWHYALLLKAYYPLRLALIHSFYKIRYAPVRIYRSLTNFCIRLYIHLINFYISGRMLVDKNYRIKIENQQRALKENNL